jgi:hypothetical protein
MELEKLAEQVGALVIADEDGTEVIFTGEQLKEFAARVIDDVSWLGREP